MCQQLDDACVQQACRDMCTRTMRNEGGGGIDLWTGQVEHECLCIFVKLLKSVHAACSRVYVLYGKVPHPTPNTVVVGVWSRSCTAHEVVDVGSSVSRMDGWMGVHEEGGWWVGLSQNVGILLGTDPLTEVDRVAVGRCGGLAVDVEGANTDVHRGRNMPSPLPPRGGATRCARSRRH